MLVVVISEELRHFWEVFFKWMSMPCGQAMLSKHAKVRVQHTTGGGALTLRQERNGDFHG